MKTKLLWVNRNVLPGTIAIYRNSVPTPNAQLSNPIANLSGTATEYVDTNVIAGQVYYYVIATTSGSTTVYTAPIKVTMQYDTGPGPNKLQYGDSQLGYFGECTYTEMFTRDELTTWAGITNSVGQVALPIWDKWIRNGKILFVPRCVIAHLVKFTDLYKMGAVYGTDQVGPPQLGSPPVIQDARIRRGYHTFKVRLMTGVDDRNNPTFIANPAKSSRAFSELADLCYPRCSYVFPIEQRGKRHLNATSWASEFGLNAASVISCMEVEATANLGLTMWPPNFSVANYTGYAVTAVTNSAGWKPILELDQTDLVIKETVI